MFTRRFYALLFVLQFCSAQQNFGINVPQNVQIAGDNDQCAAFCVQTYPPHTFENSELAKSCKQGCRLFSMLQFVGDRENRNNESVVRQTCTDDCVEAYKDDSFRRSCTDGCQHQAPYTSGAIQIQMDDSSPLFHKAVESMMDQMSSLQKHLSNQFEGARNWFNMDLPRIDDMNDDFNARVHNMFDQIEKSFGDSSNPLFNYADRLFGRTSAPTGVAAKPELNSQSDESGVVHKPLRISGDAFPGPTVGNSDDNNDPIIIVHMIPDKTPDREGAPRFAPIGDDDDDHSDEDSTMLKESANEPSPPIDQSGDSDDDWISCLARRARRLSMITRWMLCIALMLSIASMIWICLAIMRTAPRRRLMMANMKKNKYEVVYSTPPVTASDKSPMIIETKEPLPETESPPPPYEAAPIHGKAAPMA